MGNVLVIDDEQEIIDMIITCLKREGLNGVGFSDSMCAWEYVEKNSSQIDLIILDIMIPQMDGYTFLGKLRRENENLPVILLSARQEEYDKVLGLGLGADDYVTKPFSPGELMARVKVQLRKRGSSNTPATGQILVCGDIQMDVSKCLVTKAGKKVELSGKEFWLCKYLLEHPNQVFTKMQLYHAVWDENYEDDNTIMVYISHLREKLEDNPKKPEYIQTIRGIGYRMHIE